MASSFINSFNSYLLQEDGEIGRRLDHTRDKTEWNYDRNFHRGEENYYGKGPKDYWPSDERIKEKACEALFKDNLIDASEMEVTVLDGVVTLKGKVSDRKTKRMAEDCLYQIFGVENVINRLTLKPDNGLVGTMEWPI
ncbi:MAG: BON domain-containing protein [Bdellovibrionales bacterium]|nr:BON domain-containing protein [Bdellovibrionales bacterium]